jgi:hypothetical protein
MGEGMGMCALTEDLTRLRLDRVDVRGLHCAAANNRRFVRIDYVPVNQV